MKKDLTTNRSFEIKNKIQKPNILELQANLPKKD